MITHPLFPDYIIFRDGKVMNKNTGKVLKPQPNDRGYLYVRLRKDMKHHNRGVHRLILQTYNPIENDHLYHAHHIDEVRHHNHIGNLRWELISDHIREHKSSISDETRRKMSESHRGKVLSEETKKKMSESHKGHLVSEETRRKIGEKHKGLRHTEEARRKMSESLKGRVLTEEHKRKMSEALKGRPLSEEHKRKVSEAKKGELCWNNGTKTIRSKTHPGDGWVRGRL